VHSTYRSRTRWIGVVGIVACTSFLASVALCSAQTSPAWHERLRDAVYQHNKVVLDIARAKDGARVEAEDFVTDGKYRSAFVDLNDDTIADAIVLFDAAGFCGTGGCNLEFYRGTKTGLEFLSGSTISIPPIRVTSEKQYGWKTLIVSSGGTGTVLLRFNGSRYPLNPSLQPKATRAQINAALTVLERKR